MRISIASLVGDAAITLEDGWSVRDQISPMIRGQEPVLLDFQGVRIFASPFFNAAIGSLLADFAAEELRERLTFESLEPTGYELLLRVIENAKAYYASPEREQEERDRILQLVADS